MEIPTIEDFNRLETKVAELTEAINTSLNNKKRVLTGNDIIKMLRVSRRTFANRLDGLVAAGMYKFGNQWRMKEADFENYINIQKNK